MRIHLALAAPRCTGVDASWPSPAGISNKGLLHCGSRGEQPAPRLSTRLNIICVRAVQPRATPHASLRRLLCKLLRTSQTGPSASSSQCDSLALKACGSSTVARASNDMLCIYLQARNQDLVQLHGAGKVFEHVLPHVHNNEAVQLRWYPIQGCCRHIRESQVQDNICGNGRLHEIQLLTI